MGALLAILGLSAAPQAAAGLNLRQPLSGTTAAQRPGIRAQVPTQQALEQTVAQLTGGLTAREVTTKDVCAPSVGKAACAAELLVLRSNHAPVRPHVSSQRTFTQLFPTRRQGITPSAGTGSGAAPPNAGTPGWLQQAYDLTYLSQTRGAGTTVAIVDAYDNPTAESDLAVYRSTYGLPPCTSQNGCFTKINQSGQPSPLPVSDANWATEITLDLDAVSAICPNCKILLVESTTNSAYDLQTALQRAATWPGVKQVSNSWVALWTGAPPGAYTFPGIATVAASGDWGLPPSGYQWYPAALPGVTAAGGTAVTSTTGTPVARGYAESAWPYSNGWGDSAGCNTQSGIVKPSYQPDTGCSGRSYSDVSADGEPSTGLRIYNSQAGGWNLVGGTSLSSPLIAAYLAVTGIDGSSPGWAYANSALLNDPIGGSIGTCPPAWAYICTAGLGYDGPTGIGSISGAVVTGAPGIGGPPIGQGSSNLNTYTQSVTAYTADLIGGVYPNGLDTTVFWQYGTTTSYGQQTTPIAIGNGQAPALRTTTLQGLSASTQYHYRLVAQNSAGTNYGYDYTLMTAAGTAGPPVNTTAPAITGTPRQGAVLSASSGTWNPGAVSYTYRWQRSGDNGSTWSDVSGASGAGYTPGTADLGLKLRVQVTATNPYGSASATAGAVGPVLSGAPVSTGQPTISGQPTQGQVLTVTSGWSPAADATAYQWQRTSDGTTWTNIAGATAVGYTPVAVDEGARLRAVVTASNAYGTASATSATIGPIITDPPANTTAPTLSGTVQRSYVLTAGPGVWSGVGNTYAYQWQRSVDGTSWTNIGAATAATYTLAASDVGLRVRVLVTATNQKGVAGKASAPTQLVAPFPPANTVAPIVTGVQQRSYALSADPGDWTGAGNVITYQWQHDVGEGFENIPGATGVTYLLTTADVGTSIRVLVTAANPDATISEASDPTAPILTALPVNVAPPSISGPALRGAALGGALGMWTGLNNVYVQQWQRSSDGSSWTDIAGANAQTYALSVTDVGSYVRLLVKATNPDGSASAASRPTTRVQASPPSSIALPTISGTAQRGSTLSSTAGTWNGIGNTYGDQWQRSSNGSSWTDIAGATASTYALTVADEGSTIRLAITASNPDGTVTVASHASAVVQATPAANKTPPSFYGVMGAPARGGWLVGLPGTWDNADTYALQWQHSADGVRWTDISGATTENYQLALSDEGTKVRLSVTASNADGPVTIVTGPSATITASPPIKTTPTISGMAVRGHTLSCDPGHWAGYGNSYAFQWQRSSDNGASYHNIDQPDATSATYAVKVSDEGTIIRVVVTVSNPDATVSATSSILGVGKATPPVSMGAPVLSGTAQRGSRLSVTQGSWQGVDNVYAYQWQRSGDGTTWTDVPGASDLTYALAASDENTRLRVKITASNLDGTVAATSNATSTIQGAPPVNTAVPTFIGAAQRGATLTATPGTWDGLDNTYAYQWQHSRDGTTWTDIAGATDLTYALTPADENNRLRLKVTATNPDATVSATSSPSAIVPAAPPVNTTLPVVYGTAQRSFVLTASQGNWNGLGNSYAYQWQRSADGTTWTDVDGATGLSYALTAADVTTRLRFKVTASNPDATVSATSTPTGLIQGSPPQNTSAPTVTGTTVRTFTLTGTQGIWNGFGNAYAYRWQRSTNGTTWSDVTGATSSTYVLDTGDEGAQLRIVVTASNPDGSVSVPSAPTAAVQGAPPVSTSPPTIAGTAQRSSTLFASPGGWSGIGNAYAYQWQRSTDGSTWTDVGGATGTTYLIGVSDEGLRMRVIVTATNPDASVSAASSPSGVVQKVPPGNTTAPTIAGTPQRGATLSGSQGVWTGPGNTYAYQWQRMNSVGAFLDIAGATSTTYVPVVADEHTLLRVRVTATNPDGTVSSWSGPAGPIAATPPIVTANPVITGTARVGAALSASSGNWWPADASFTYQWQRGTTGAQGYTDIPGATAAAYTPVAADAGLSLRVKVTATNVDGSASSTSAATALVAQPPSSTRPPAAPSGTLMDTYTLTADPGGWDVSTATFGYSWLRCPAGATSADASCTPIGTGPTHTLAAADVGFQIAVAVTATSVGGVTGPVYGALTDPIAGRPLTNVTRPSIAGTPQIPLTLTVRAGAWSLSPTSISYSWQRCDRDGASNCTQAAAGGASYALGAADRGHTIVAVEAVTSPGRTASATSAPVTVQDQPLAQASTAPTVSGNPQRGSTLTASPGTWTNNPTLDYQWLKCSADGTSCQPIPVATSLTYLLTRADEGAAFTIRVGATNTTGTTVAIAKPTAAVAPLLPVNLSRPVIKGPSIQQSVQLGISGYDWQATPDTVFADAWLRCGADGSGCQPIGGATNGIYTPSAADVGHTLVVVVTATNVDGSVKATSDPTTIVLPAGPRWRTLPKVAAPSANVGDQVSITRGTWSGPAIDSDLVEIMRCTNTCTAVGQQNVTGYAIADADVGAILRVRESASNAGGSTVAWSSRYVGPVSSPAAASTVLAAGRQPLRNSKGVMLATAQLTSTASPGRFTSNTPTRAIKLRRAGSVKGTLKAWVCPVASTSTGAPPACTAQVTLNASASVRIPTSMTGKLRIVVVRRGR